MTPDDTPDLAALLDEAVTLVLHHRFEEASERFSALAQASPEAAEAGRGMLAFLRNDASAALQHFRKLTAAEPASAEFLALEGLAWHRLERDDEARDCFDRALRLDPGHLAAHLGQGKVLARRERYREAEQHFRRVLAAAPALYDANLGLGVVLLQQGRTEEALAPLVKAAEQAPQQEEAYLALSHVAMRLEMFAETAEILDGFAVPLTGSPELLYRLALCYLRSGKHGEAARAAALLATMVEPRPDAELSVGSLLVAAGEPSQAWDHFARVAQDETATPRQQAEALHHCALILEAVGNREQAARYYHHARTADPSHWESQCNLAGLLLTPASDDELRRRARPAAALAEAEVLLTRALEHGGDQPEILFNRGLLLFWQGRLSEARTLLRQLARSPRTGPQLAARSRTLLRQLDQV